MFLFFLFILNSLSYLNIKVLLTEWIVPILLYQNNTMYYKFYNSIIRRILFLKKEPDILNVLNEIKNY